ncbi:MAG: hypothetical protein ACI89G_001349 [Minisyncoccia bacterium]|jgi:hypothetical protein
MEIESPDVVVIQEIRKAQATDDALRLGASWVELNWVELNVT